MKIKFLHYSLMIVISLSLHASAHGKKAPKPATVKKQIATAEHTPPLIEHEEDFEVTAALQELGVGPGSTPSQFGKQSIQQLIESHHSPLLRSPQQPDPRIAQFNAAFSDWVRSDYNQPHYAEHLSQNPTDFLIWLEMIQNLRLPRNESTTLAYTILNLWLSKLKEPSVEIIDATVIQKMLTELPRVLKHLFVAQHDYATISMSSMIKATEDMLIASFTSHLDIIQSDPRASGREMADAISNSFEQEVLRVLEAQEDKIRLQQLTIRLLEHGISKMMWGRSGFEEFVPSLNALAHQTLLFAKGGLIEHADDYDSITKSLVCRACYYLDLCGWTFPQDFFTHLEAQLRNGEIPCLEETEQDAFIRTKRELFIDTATKAKTKSLAYHRAGIIPEQAW